MQLQSTMERISDLLDREWSMTLEVTPTSDGTCDITMIDDDGELSAVVGLAGCASSPFDSVGVSGEYQNKDGERFGGGIGGHLRDTRGLSK